MEEKNTILDKKDFEGKCNCNTSVHLYQRVKNCISTSHTNLSSNSFYCTIFFHFSPIVEKERLCRDTCIDILCIILGIYRVINLILPNSRPLLPHFFTNKQASFFGAFNPEFWSILFYEIRFLIFKNLIFSPKS